MKYLVIIGDGMGDRPRPELGGQTVLQAAATPHMDRLASEGRLGLTQTIPEGKEPGSDTANMSLMGFDPALYHTGRSPIEAAAMGVELAPDEVAFRCNLVTLDHSGPAVVMADYSAGHITTEPAGQIIAALQERLGTAELRFHPGVSYRHLLVWKNGPLGAETVPPHDRTTQPVDDILGRQGDMALVNDLVRASWPVLAELEYNRKQRRQGRPEANSIWLWGQGTRPRLPTYGERFGLSGVVVAAVDLIKGLGVLAGLETVEVPGATGDLHTNHAGKVAAVLEGLRRHDLAIIHVEAPDEAGHSGILADKLKAIEDFDAKVVGPLMAGLAEMGPHRVLLATDHYTPLEERTHTREPVPFVLWDSQDRTGQGLSYDEPTAEAQGVWLPQAHHLVEQLIHR